IICQLILVQFAILSAADLILLIQLVLESLVKWSLFDFFITDLDDDLCDKATLVSIIESGEVLGDDEANKRRYGSLWCRVFLFIMVPLFFFINHVSPIIFLSAR
ncbi:hypothetical protein ACJX0J_037183, partial [Zea mays]